jgi:plasmid stabilization system protein ParE
MTMRAASYYLKNAGARVALHVSTELDKAFGSLAATPGKGPVRPDLTAEPVKFSQVFSYLIVYDPATQPLGIARVLHSSQGLESLFRKNLPRGG